MRLFAIAAAALALLAAAPASAAELVGDYTIEGSNPGNRGHYTGRVTVRKTGETYSVVWVVGNTRYVGTGIGNKDFIAVSYRSGNDTGLALYREDGGNWDGIWTYAGGKQIGLERWLRQ
jgi:hypothetical protein